MLYAVLVVALVETGPGWSSSWCGPTSPWGKVIKWHTAAFIFLNNGKSRTVYRLCDSQSLCHSLGKNGLTYPKISYQCVYLPGKSIFPNPFAESEGLFWAECFFYHNFTTPFYLQNCSLHIIIERITKYNTF